MMEPTKDRVCNNISEPLDRACVGVTLSSRMSSRRSLLSFPFSAALLGSVAMTQA
jgi:hypothetical protein